MALPAAVTMTLDAPDVAEAQQPPSEPDYDEWDKLAQRADEAVEQARLSSPALEELRAEVEWMLDRAPTDPKGATDAKGRQAFGQQFTRPCYRYASTGNGGNGYITWR